MTEWERCAPWLEAALAEAPETHDLEDVRRMVEEGGAYFFPFEHCAFVCLVWDDPRAKTCSLWLAGGELEAAVSASSQIERWAKANGCTRMLIPGRKGWERVMSPYGYAHAATILHKEL